MTRVGGRGESGGGRPGRGGGGRGLGTGTVPQRLGHRDYPSDFGDVQMQGLWHGRDVQPLAVVGAKTTHLRAGEPGTSQASPNLDCALSSPSTADMRKQRAGGPVPSPSLRMGPHPYLCLSGSRTQGPACLHCQVGDPSVYPKGDLWGGGKEVWSPFVFASVSGEDTR